MQLKIAFLLMFPCLVGAQVYNPSNNLPSSASFPGHNAMGAAGAINTGQWDKGFGLEGPTNNLLNVQETNTSGAGENGLITILNWNPASPSDFPNVAALVGQLNANFDNSTSSADTQTTGVIGNTVLSGNTVGQNISIGVAGNSGVTGTAPVSTVGGIRGQVFHESTATAQSEMGAEGYVEVDAGHVVAVTGLWAQYYVDPGATAGTARSIYIADPGSVATVTHPYAIQSDSVQPSVFAGLIATSKGGAVTSATSITPTGQIFHVTGTTAVATIVAPAGCTDANRGCQLTLIPDAAFTTTAAGNIALASTAVLNKALIMTYDSGTSKWYPSY